MSNKLSKTLGVALATATATPIVTITPFATEEKAEMSTQKTKDVDGVEDKVTVIEGVSDTEVRDDALDKDVTDETDTDVTDDIDEIVVEDITEGVPEQYTTTFNMDMIYVQNLAEAEEAVQKANAELEEKKARDEEVLKELVQANTDLEQAKADVEVAEQELEEAKAKAEGITEEVLEVDLSEVTEAEELKAQAEQAHATAEAEYNNTLALQASAQQAYDSVVSALNTTQAEADALGVRIAELQTLVAEQQAKVDSLGFNDDTIEEYSVEHTKLLELQQELANSGVIYDGKLAEVQAVQGEITAKEAEIATLNAQLETARQAEEQANANLATANEAYDKVVAEKNEAIAVWNAQKTARDEAVQAQTDAQNKVNEAKAKLDQAQKAKEEADKKSSAESQAVKNAEQALANAQAKYNQGSAGFFKYLADKGDADAKLAYQIITAKGTSMQDGSRKNFNIAGYTHLGEAGDATNLENMKKAVDELNMVNEYRKKENKGLADLKVTNSLMAISQWNANYSANNIEHAQTFNTGENIAWGYKNPFDGWYDEEKKMYNAGNHNFHDVGHYLNIIDKGYVAMGYAYNTKSSYSREYLQAFGTSGSKYSKGAISVSAYQNKFNSYYNTVKSNLEKAQKNYEDVKRSGANTEDGRKAQEAYDKALKEYNNAVAEYDNAVKVKVAEQNKLNTAQRTMNEKQQAVIDERKKVNEVKQVAVNAVKETEAKQKALDTAKADRKALDTKLADAKKANEENNVKYNEMKKKIDDQIEYIKKFTNYELMFDLQNTKQTLADVLVKEAKVQAEIAGYKKDRDAKKEALDKATDAIKTKKTALEKAKSDLQGAKEIYEEAKAKYDDDKGKYDAVKEAERKVLSATVRVDSLTKTIADLEAEHEENTKVIKYLDAYIEKADVNLKDLKAKAEELKRQEEIKAKAEEETITYDEKDAPVETRAKAEEVDDHKDTELETVDDKNTGVVTTIAGYEILMGIAGAGMIATVFTKKRKYRN